MTDKAKVKAPWHRDPLYKPNYGHVKSLLPPTCLKHVVLHENVGEQRRLAEETRLLDKQKAWNQRLCNRKKKSFIIRQLIQQQMSLASGYGGHSHARLIPEHVVERHLQAANTEIRRLFYTGGKNLPNHERFRTLLARHDTMDLLERINEHDTSGEQEGITRHAGGEQEGITRHAGGEHGDAGHEQQLVTHALSNDVMTQEVAAQATDTAILHDHFPITQLERLPCQPVVPVDDQSRRRCYYSKRAMENVQHTLLYNPDNPFALAAQTRSQPRKPRLPRQTSRPRLSRRSNTTSAIKPCRDFTDDPRFTALQHSLKAPRHPDHTHELTALALRHNSMTAAPLDGFALLSASNDGGVRITSAQKQTLRSKYLPTIKPQLDPRRIHNALATARRVGRRAVVDEIDLYEE